MFRNHVPEQILISNFQFLLLPNANICRVEKFSNFFSKEKIDLHFVLECIILHKDKKMHQIVTVIGSM